MYMCVGLNMCVDIYIFFFSDLYGRLRDKASLPPHKLLGAAPITFQSEECVAAQEWGIDCGCREKAF